MAYVSNSLRLLTLPDALKDGLLSGLISEGHARALAAIDDTSLMVEAYKIMLAAMIISFSIGLLFWKIFGWI